MIVQNLMAILLIVVVIFQSGDFKLHLDLSLLIYLLKRDIPV